MKVYWYECGQKHGNLGDKLTPLLLDYFSVPFEWSPPEKAALFGIGSILHKLPHNYQGVVWSTGSISGGEVHELSAARVLALRGKLTLAQVKCRERDTICLGDGGLLAYLFFRPCRKHFKLGVIPHYTQAGEPVFAELAENPNITCIDICDEPRSVIQQIGECEHIVSSSLHGLIVADSLGVPNRWIDIATDVPTIQGNGFKFRDYYSIFNIENPQPELLRQETTLDALLPLFEEYQRPSIDERKAQLLENFRDVVEPISRYSWAMAKQDIVSRERDIFRRLEQQGASHLELIAGTGPRDSEFDERRAPQSFDEFRTILKRDGQLLGRFFFDLLSQLNLLHQHGIAHGDIRDGNIIANSQRPILTNFGWRVPSDDINTSSHTHNAAADVRAVGKLVRELADNHPYVATVAGLLMQSQPKRSIIQLDSACNLIQLFLVREAGTGDDALSDSPQPALSDVAHAVRRLLEVIAGRDQEMSSLRAELAATRHCQWQIELRLATMQLRHIVAEDKTYVLIDEDAWRSEFGDRPKPVPFLERNATYWGPPEDDEAAVQEIIRLQRDGAEYVVIGKPAFWWLTYYKGLREYLESTADPYYKDDLLIVYRLRDEPGHSES